MIETNRCSDLFDDPGGNPCGSEVRFLINGIAAKECVHDFYDMKPTKLSNNLKDQLTDALKTISNNARDPSSKTVYTTERNEEGELKLVLIPRNQIAKTKLGNNDLKSSIETVNDVVKYLNNQRNAITNKENKNENQLQLLSVQSCDLISHNNCGTDKIDEHQVSILSDCTTIFSPHTPNKPENNYGNGTQEDVQLYLSPELSNNTLMKSMKQHCKSYPRNISGLLNKTILDDELQKLQAINDECNIVQAVRDFGNSDECLFTSTPKRTKLLDTSTDLEKYNLTDCFNLMDNLQHSHQNTSAEQKDVNISDSSCSSFHGFTTDDLLPPKSCMYFFVV